VSTGIRDSFVLLLVALTAAAGTSIAGGASPLQSALAIGLVFTLGYVAGALVLPPPPERESISLAVVRCVAGLFLSTVAFLFSLLLQLPWFVGPAAAFAAAVIGCRRSAFLPPRLNVRPTAGGAVAALLGIVILAPAFITALRMGSGPFPSVFFNVDTPYVLEKVHALTTATTYPPPSLGVAGGLTINHYGVQGAAALIARGSGLAPHHVLFLIVMPLLTIGIAAGAAALASFLSPRVPVWAAVPLLLIPVPTLWYPFGAEISWALEKAFAGGGIGPLDRLTASVEVWGVTFNPATSLGSLFLVPACLAAIATARSRGWRLAVFLVGTAIIVKASTAVALAAGFVVFLACTGLMTRDLRTYVRPVLGVVAVFAVVYIALFVVPGNPENASSVEPALLYHLRMLVRREGMYGFWRDVIWLFLPVAVLIAAGWRSAGSSRSWRSLPLLAFAGTPLILVNALHLVGGRPDGDAIIDQNWLQVLVPLATIFHAFVLGLANDWWPSIGRAAKASFLAAIVLTIFPSVFVAGRYGRTLAREPERGHEYVDNRPLAAALAAIPVAGTLIVTNDLRYPADGFSRDDRQMQIPALFGHTAFAVNFAYEHYGFSEARRAAQNLVRAAEWDVRIAGAAREHGWSHLLIRQDYPHPSSIPLPKLFDNGTYAVYRFDAGPEATRLSTGTSPSDAASRVSMATARPGRRTLQPATRRGQEGARQGGE